MMAVKGFKFFICSLLAIDTRSRTRRNPLANSIKRSSPLASTRNSEMVHVAVHHCDAEEDVELSDFSSVDPCEKKQERDDIIARVTNG